MSLAIPHQFRKRESPISSTKVNENNAVIVSYINSLEDGLTSNIYSLIPQGTRMVFYQAAAPAGWTLVTGIDDKFLRIVSGGGGATGGAMAASTNLDHLHTTGDFTITLSQLPSHTHKILATHNASSGWGSEIYGDAASIGVSGARAGTGGSAYYASNPGGSGSASIEATGSGGTHNHGNTGSTAIGIFAHADVIVASKD